LWDGSAKNRSTTSLHLDILRDLKRIHSHICSAAYSVLDGARQTLVADKTESDEVTMAAQGPKPETP
jgi:phosphate:Na+ symporter